MGGWPGKEPHTKAASPVGPRAPGTGVCNVCRVFLCHLLA